MQNRTLGLANARACANRSLAIALPLSDAPRGTRENVLDVKPEVFIQVKAGKGGNGEIVESDKGKMVRNFKYKPGGSQAKNMWLPISTPADGADGTTTCFTFTSARTMSALTGPMRKKYVSLNGPNGDVSKGSAGPKKNRDIKKGYSPPLIIPVPPGTVVKRKSSGALIGDLTQPGERLVVAAGGKGGMGAKAPSRESNINRRERQFAKAE
eukprot:gene23451-17324_t